MKKKPLVSCLCISQNRPEYLTKAISCFLAQTYAEKELVIVSRYHDPVYDEIISLYADRGVRYYGLQTPTELTMGELRNFAIDKSEGEFFCIWDDDDWYHNKRIEIQIQGIMEGRKSGSILPYCLLFDSVNKQAYLSSPTLMVPASVMCKKDSIEQKALYQPLNKEEDIRFLSYLVENRMLFPVVAPILYVYVYHARNLSNTNHFNEIFASSIKLSAPFSALIGDIVNSKYSCEAGSELLNNSDLHNELDYFPGLRWAQPGSSPVGAA